MREVKRFNPGDQLTREVIDSQADAINQLVREVKTRRQAKNLPTQTLVYIENNTGADLDYCAVLGLGEPRHNDPTGDGEAFKWGELTFLGETPAEGTHEGKFAVLQDPLAAGNTALSTIQGVVRVKVAFTTGDEKWADITDGDSTCLTAAASGSARILWREGTGTGTVWCVCLLTGGRDECVAATSEDSTPGALRSTDDELAEDPPKPHKVVGDDEEQIDETAADGGWIACEVLGAAEANQQLVIGHKHTGETLDTRAYLGGCYVNNLRLDAGHIIAVQLTTGGGQAWYDAFTGEPL